MELYLKYRPNSFDEMVGNKDQIASLKKQFEKENHSHVFLFTGNPGCGKTTAARICASLVNAVVIEINSADNRGIDIAREIAEQMQTRPIGEFKSWAFILDEVHMTLGTFQNNMLKTLEDTPKHVYFFLCTTDPQKLLPTIRSRCTVFNFDTLSEQQIYKVLSRVIEKEHIDVHEDVTEAIADNCQGSSRNALKLLEKVVGMERAKALKVVKEGSIEDAEVKELCQGLFKGVSWSECAAILKGLKDIDPEKIRYAVIGYMNAVLLNGKQDDRAAQVIYEFREPFYATGKAGLTLACYQVLVK
jgi:DNA polymerase-3 subunit gamma/tau